MDDHAEQQPRSRVVAYIVITAVLLPLLYILSIGPAIVIVREFPSLEGPGNVIYQPIIWLDKNTFMKGPLEKYAEFWNRLGQHI